MAQPSGPRVRPSSWISLASSGSVCTSDTTPVLHGCVAQVTQVRLAAIPEIDPRLKCKTVKLYGFYFQAIDSKWDILEDRKILRFRFSFVRRSRVGKLGVSIRSRAAAKQADQRSPRDRFLSCGVSPGGRFRKLTHYPIPEFVKHLFSIRRSYVKDRTWPICESLKNGNRLRSQFIRYEFEENR